MPNLKSTLANLTDDQLDQLAQITDQDVLAAHQFITQALSKRYKNLLLARPTDDNAGTDRQPEARPANA